MYEQTNFLNLPTCDIRLPNVICTWSQGLYRINPAIHKNIETSLPRIYISWQQYKNSRDILIAKGYVTIYTELYCIHIKYIYFILQFISLGIDPGYTELKVRITNRNAKGEEENDLGLIYLLS
jgi:hypothetical protein